MIFDGCLDCDSGVEKGKMDMRWVKVVMMMEDRW